MNRFRPFLIVLGLIGYLSTACSGGPALGRASATPRSSTSPQPSVASVASLTPTVSLTPTASAPPTAFLTSTVTPVPCDPSAGYCIVTGHFFFNRPIVPPGVAEIEQSYAYGTTENGTREPHHGVDLLNPTGTPVLAAADGQVVIAGNDSKTIYALVPDFYGNLVVLEHTLPGINEPVYTFYGHLSKIDITVGQTVQAGEQIGEVGSTGIAIGSHLFFEVRMGQNNYDSDRNPMLWLKPLTGQDGKPYGVIAGRLVDAKENLIYTQSFTIQYFINRTGPQTAVYGIETYAPEKHPVGRDDLWQENFALGDLLAGNYRLSFVWNEKLFVRWVEVQPGQLTLVTFKVN